MTVFLLCGLAGFSASAADATLTGSASPSTVPVGEQLEVTFTLNGNGSNFHAPTFNDFNVLMGPNQSTSMQFINGSVSQSISYTYVLQATKEGTFKFGSATMDAGGKKISSNQVTVTVVKGTPPAKQGGSQGNQQNNDAAMAGGKNVFLRATVDKSTVYQGEGILVTYKLYTKVNIANYSISKLPALNGFWSQEMTQPQQQAQFHSENYDGVNYKVAEIKKMVIFPQRSGTLELDPMEGEVIAQVQVKRQKSNDPFNQFFNDPFFNLNQWQNVKVPLKSDLVKITVHDLPPGAPATFNGAVGKFNVDVSLDKKETKAHEAVTLKIKISGKGNLKLLDAPKINFPAEFETYDPKINSAITATPAGVSGSKTFEYLVIPRNAGEFKIPVAGFSFFDLEKKKYESLPSQDLVVKVGKGDETTITTVTGVSKSDVQLLGKDIHFIKTNRPEFIQGGHSLFGSGIFYALLAAPALLFGSLLVFRKKYLEMQSNVGLLKSQRANKVAKKRLGAARKYLAANDKEKFLDEMFRALWGFVSDKLQIPVSELSKESASLALQNKNINEELIRRFTETIDSCEFARFAPGMAAGNEEIYKKGIEVIVKLEEEIG